MRRRDLIALVASVAALCPLAGLAQQPKVTTIGVLAVQAPGTERFWRLFREDLEKLGYVEGQNVRFEFRQEEVIRLPELAAELVGLKVDLIVTWFAPAAFAAKQATHEIPIVMASSANPVEMGLVASLARPGGNITGMGGLTAELVGKCVELIREMLPSARRIAVLANAPDPFSKPFLEQIRLSGEATGTTIEPFMIHTAEELDAAFPEMNKEQADAVIVQPSLPPKRTADLALRYRMPAVSWVRDIVDEGALMSYGFDQPDVYRHAAVLVDKVLKGAKPAELPVEQPSKFELVVNLKTAKALGLTIPPLFLARADEVIE